MLDFGVIACKKSLHDQILTGVVDGDMQISGVCHQRNVGREYPDTKLHGIDMASRWIILDDGVITVTTAKPVDIIATAAD